MLFVANGRLVYYGEPSASVKAFERFGFACPNNFNAADFIIWTLSVEPKREDECRERIDEICRRFGETSEGRALNATLEQSRRESLIRTPKKVKRKMAAFPLQVVARVF